MRYTMMVVAICVSVVLCGCDSESEPLSPAISHIELAPAKDDPKVYICPSQNLYHLANCPNRCKDQQLGLKSEAELLGCEPCELCFPVPQTKRPPMVYILPGEILYHRALCPCLNEAKNIISLSDVAEQGYVPCPVCMIDIYIPGQLVYVTETGENITYIYHSNPDCKHLDHLNTQKKLARAQPYWKAYSNSIRDECNDCYEERHVGKDEEE